jgi:hypothetical protein
MSANGPPYRPNSGGGDTAPAAVTTTGNLTKSQKNHSTQTQNSFFNPLEHKFKPQNEIKQKSEKSQQTKKT